MPLSDAEKIADQLHHRMCIDECPNERECVNYKIIWQHILEARTAAIEEAAKIAEKYVHGYCDADCGLTIAKNIRAVSRKAGG